MWRGEASLPAAEVRWPDREARTRKDDGKMRPAPTGDAGGLVVVTPLDGRRAQGAEQANFKAVFSHGFT